MDSDRDLQLRFLHLLAEEHAYIAADLVMLGEGSYAIHGTIPLDGEVLMASFNREQDARGVLEQLGFQA